MSIPEFRFHHLGIACASLTRSAELYRLLGMVHKDWTVPVVDPIQGVEVAFNAVGKEGLAVELVGPSTSSSPVSAALSRNNGLSHPYHLAFSVDEIDKALGYLRNSGCIILSRSERAAAFEGAPIAFVVLKDGLLIELIGSSERD